VKTYKTSEVKLSEFFDAAWTVGKSPGIQKISSFTNALTYMLAGEIVSASKKEKRLKLLGKLIKLGKVPIRKNLLCRLALLGEEGGGNKRRR
jgi:hypothetical protein